MKKASHVKGLGFVGALLMSAALCMWMAATAVALPATGTQYCEIELTRCPEDYDSVTLTVPLSVVSLSSKIRACQTQQQGSVDASETPAIMFVIDNTGSMASNPGNDRNGNRYRVARAIIDSVYAKIPTAEIGMVVFDAGLFLNKSGGLNPIDPNLVKFQGVPYYKPDSIAEMYMPLLALNKPAQAGGFVAAGGTPNGIDVYRRMLVDGGANGTSGIRNPAGGNLGNGSGTNVSIAFEAAQEQFAKTAVLPKNQYIIFISDGRYEINTATPPHGGCSGASFDGLEPANPSIGNGLYGNSARCPKQADFMTGSINGRGIPTTYTVFLNTDAPATMAANRAVLDNMTNAVKANNYSTTNASSDIWTADGNNYQGLLTLMMNNIIKQMITTTDNRPQQVVVESAGIKDSAGNIDSVFGFQRMLPIDTSSKAEVNMKIVYFVSKDSTYKDPVTGQDVTVTLPPTYRPQDFVFWIQRTANPGNNWAGSQGLAEKCKDKPVIDLIFEGTVIDTIKPHMGTLTVRFTKNDFFDYKTSDVNIIISTTDKGNTVLDTLRTNVLGAPLIVNPGQSNEYWEWTFTRVNNGAATGVNKNDGVLQHQVLNDKIVVFFSNPRIPLDEITKIYPYVSFATAFDVVTPNRQGPARVLPEDTLGLRPADRAKEQRAKDTLIVRAGDELNIKALLLGDGGGIDQAMLDLLDFTFVLEGGGAGGAVVEKTGKNTASFTAFTAYNADGSPASYTVRATASAPGGLLNFNEKFTIIVDPGKAAYIEVVFKDPSKDAPPKSRDTTYLQNPKILEIHKGVEDTTLYVVSRDKFGNYIGATSGAWDYEGGAINVPRTNSSNAKVSREGDAYSSGNKVIVRGADGMTDVVEVTVVGNASTALGPNPFIPGVSNPRDAFTGPNAKLAEEYYKEILDAPTVGGIGTSRGPAGGPGILVAGTAPLEIKKDGRGAPRATVVIYDAVGHVVFKSLPEHLTLGENNTFGFVWNGKNGKGRDVAPGTYLVRMNIVMKDAKGQDQKLVEQKKIGVTKKK